MLNERERESLIQYAEDLLMARREQESEKAIEEKVVKWAKGNGWLALKFTPKGDVGWPDRIFISPRGLHCWIEFKAPGKGPTPLQLKRMNQIRNQGGVAAWFDDADATIEWLEVFD